MLVYARCGASHLVLAHGRESPSDGEWDAYLNDLERWGPEIVGTLIVTEGGGPTGAQRRLLKERLQKGGITFRTAVLSESLLVRGIVITLNMFDSNIRAFHPDAIDAALTYVRAALHGPTLLAEVKLLRMRLGVVEP